jgi:hypothetical protein
MAKQISDKSLEWAVEITKAAAPMQNGSWLSHPKETAEFVGILAEKIESLRMGTD